MRTLIFALVLILWQLTTVALAAEEVSVLESVTRPGAQGYVSSEFIYPLEGRQTPQCHASTIAVTADGLVAAWFGGQREKNPDVGIWVSRKQKGPWTQPVEVVNGVQSEDVRYPCWNPVLFQPSDGPLLLFYKVGPSPGAWWGLLTTSTDGGRSWSQPSVLGKDPAIGHLIGPVKNKPIELADGSILCPSSSEHDRWRVHFELSRDQGKTWKVIGPIHDGTRFNAIEPSILTYSDGSLQVLCRTKEGVVAQSRSRDGGKTWTQPAATHLPNPNSGTDAITLRDGRQLLVYNHTQRREKFPSGRNMLNVALSDDGKAWRPVITLERDQGEYSYPSVVQADSGMLHVVYTWRRQTVKHAVLDPEKIK